MMHDRPHLAWSPIRRIHLVGIGGIGMSGLAEWLVREQFTVTGSDSAENEQTEHLRTLGVRIYIGHHSDNVGTADLVVHTSAVKATENEETKAALSRGIRVIKRSELLAELMRPKLSVGIAGTHGKTTTTTMMGLVFEKAGYDPTVMVGGRVSNFNNTNLRLGKGPIFVVEADEYDRTFLKLHPVHTIITNIDEDHLDIYQDLDDIKKAFIEYAHLLPFYGVVSACIDDDGVREVLPKLQRHVVTYGFATDAQLTARDIDLRAMGSTFTAVRRGMKIGSITLNVPGRHNILNALGVIGMALEMGLSFEQISEGLAAFRGVNRRFELVSETNGIMVIDDYAHHPAEIEATLNAAKTGWPDRRLIAAFQPHLYSRTKDFYEEFGRAMTIADVAVVTEIYPAREKPIAGVTGKMIADAAISFTSNRVEFLKDKTQLPALLHTIVQPGDIVITMGAGDIYKLGRDFAASIGKGGA
jgi:UDP-N-acetylmuramate--alanine ligase